MEARLGTCINCGREESYDCQLYLCIDNDGFLVISCIVYAINNHLRIIKRLDGLLDNED